MVDAEVRALFNDLVFALPYERYARRMSATRYRKIVKLTVYDRYWEEPEGNLCKWLRLQPKEIADARESTEYQEILADLEQAMDRLLESGGYESLLADQQFQRRIHREQKALAVGASDERVREKVMTTLTDRLAPRLSQTRIHETSEKYVRVEGVVLQGMLDGAEEAGLERPRLRDVKLVGAGSPPVRDEPASRDPTDGE